MGKITYEVEFSVIFRAEERHNNNAESTWKHEVEVELGSQETQAQIARILQERLASYNEIPPSDVKVRVLKLVKLR